MARVRLGVGGQRPSRDSHGLAGGSP